jgi:hypothetical protein
VDSSRYEIRVRGRLGRGTLERFPGFEAEAKPAQTVLRGAVRDQAALHGLLDQLESLGLELLEVRRVPAGARPSANGDRAPG